MSAGKRPLLGFSLALSTCLMWATLPVTLKMSLEALDPMTLTWFRFLCAFLFTFALLALRGQLTPIKAALPAQKIWLLIAALGLIGNYVWYLLGLKYTSPANAQFLIQSAPLLLALGSVVFFKERVGIGQSLGFGAILLGLLGFAAEQQGVATDTRSYGLGLLLIALAAISWAIYALIQKRLTAHLNSQQIMLVMYAVAAVLLVFTAKPSSLLSLDSVHAWAVAYCAFNTIAAYGAFAEAMVLWEASRVSAVLSMTPVITIAVVHLLAPLMPTHLSPERIGWLGAISALLVVGGSMAASLLKPKAF